MIFGDIVEIVSFEETEVYGFTLAIGQLVEDADKLFPCFLVKLFRDQKIFMREFNFKEIFRRAFTIDKAVFPAVNCRKYDDGELLTNSP